MLTGDCLFPPHASFPFIFFHCPGPIENKIHLGTPKVLSSAFFVINTNLHESEMRTHLIFDKLKEIMLPCSPPYDHSANIQKDVLLLAFLCLLFHTTRFIFFNCKTNSVKAIIKNEVHYWFFILLKPNLHVVTSNKKAREKGK